MMMFNPDVYTVPTKSLLKLISLFTAKTENDGQTKYKKRSKQLLIETDDLPEG